MEVASREVGLPMEGLLEVGWTDQQPELAMTVTELGLVTMAQR